MDVIIDKAVAHVRELTSKNDASHDFEHIRRVVDFAKVIQRSEESRPDAPPVDTNVVALVAILHHAGDAEYLGFAEESNTVVQRFLTSLGCSPHLAQKLQYICSRISYSYELDNLDDVAQLCSFIPELAIVQDADRLDALGATSVARAFMSNAAVLHDGTLSIEHFQVLLPLAERMKTNTGKKLARQLTERMKLFLNWLEAEEETRQGKDDEIQTHSDVIREDRSTILAEDRALQPSTTRANQAGRVASAAAKVKTRNVIMGEEATRRELAVSPHQDAMFIPSSFESDISPPPANRVVKRASRPSFMSVVNDDGRKRARLSFHGQVENGGEDVQKDRMFSLPTRSVTPASTFDSDGPAPIMTGSVRFLRHPTAIDQPYSTDEAKWQQLDAMRQRNLTHIGLIAETTDGMDSAKPCDNCEKKGLTCRKYRPSVSTAYEQTFGGTCEICAHCKWQHKTCE